MSIALLKKSLLILEIICALVAIGTFRKWKNSYWQYFVLYLVFIAIAESVGYYLRVHRLREAQQMMYTFLVIPAEFFFFFFLFSKMLPGKRMNYLAIASAAIFIFCIVLEHSLLKTSKFYFLSLSYTVGNIFLLMFIFIFLSRLLDSKDILVFQYNPGFWVSIGLLIFYLFTFPFFGLFNYLVKNFNDFSKGYAKAMLILNCLMYLTFSIGLLWAKRRSPYS